MLEFGAESMTTRIKTRALSAALALGATGAFAVPVTVNPGGSTTLDGVVGAGSVSINVAVPDGGKATGTGGITGLIGLKLSWTGEPEVSGTSPSTLFKPGDTKTFLVSWTSCDGSDCPDDFPVTVSVAAVPLPAGVLLLGTGLAAFGWARRRKTA